MKMKSIRRFLPIVLFVLVFLVGCSGLNTDLDGEIGNTQEEAYTAEELELIDLLERNLYAASHKDIDGYLSTISEKGHEDTREAMTTFFEQFDVTHTLLEFELVEQQEKEWVAKTSQKSEATQENVEVEYKDHIVEALHTFIKEDNEWKIDETSILDVRFIE